MKMKVIGRDEVMSLLTYFPESGLFRWNSDRASHVKAGDLAGTLDKSTGYIRIGIRRTQYRAHRLAWLYMTGSLPPFQVDHIDHNRRNNAWHNLRLASPQDNSRNQKLRKNNKSGVTGVKLYAPSGRWLAIIRAHGKTRHIGYYEDWFDAVCARKSAEVVHSYHKNHGV